MQAHGPGFSKILLGDDQVDDWERYLDVMVDSVFANSGRSCINCSGIWASRHTRDIADALARRLADVRPLPPQHPDAGLAAFTVPGVAEAISQAIDADLQTPGVTDVTATYRDGGRVVKEGTADYLLPTVVHCDAPDAGVAKAEYMFPFVSVVECPQARMLDAIGPTLVCSAITGHEGFHRQLLDAVHIDRLNLGSRSDHAAQLASATRRQHRGLSVPRACVPGLAAPGNARRGFAAVLMRILSITAGAAGMYCGSCTRDNALARELMALGHDVTLLPVYTPTRPDEPNVSRPRVLFGGISVYLQQYAPIFRSMPRLLDRLWDSPRVIQAFSSRAISTDARMLGGLTISMLQGEQGALRREFDKLVDWIRAEPLPDVINLPNTLLVALAAPLKRAFNRPVCLHHAGARNSSWTASCLRTASRRSR